MHVDFEPQTKSVWHTEQRHHKQHKCISELVHRRFNYHRNWEQRKNKKYERTKTGHSIARKIRVTAAPTMKISSNPRTVDFVGCTHM